MSKTEDYMVLAIKQMHADLRGKIDALNVAIDKVHATWPAIDEAVSHLQRRLRHIEGRLSSMEARYRPADSDLQNRRRIMS